MSTPCHARPGSCGSPGERADSSPKPRVVPGRFSLVVFDFDGTLADTFELFVHAQRRLARQFGFRPIETADLEQARGRSAMALMRASGLARWKLPLVASAFPRIIRTEGDRRTEVTLEQIGGRQEFSAVKLLPAAHHHLAVADTGLGNVDASDTNLGLNVIGGAYFGSGSMRPFAQLYLTLGDGSTVGASAGLLFVL